MHEADFYQKLSDGRVHCGLCRFRCVISDGRRGICMVRENQGGTLYSLVYGKIIAEQVDPVEKKPLFHFLPGSRTYSIATPGCNFRCRHCQNYSISQVGPEQKIAGKETPAEDVVARAKTSGCSSISYTYTEPTIFLEYALETAELAHASGLKNIFVTNGYITPEALLRVRPFLDGANIDLKGFSEKFYREVVGARLDQVLECIIDYKRLGVWIEITTLIIPNLNDSDEDLSGIANFIKNELGPETPWHVSGFYPTWKLLDQPPTPVETLLRARQIGLDTGLSHVYQGNVLGQGGENTYCHSCGMLLVNRLGYRIREMMIADGKCPSCSAVISGLF